MRNRVGKPRGIERLDDSEDADREPALLLWRCPMRCHVASFKSAQFGAFGDRLLHVVFAEVARARAIGRANGIGRLGLAREHQADRIG